LNVGPISRSGALWVGSAGASLAFRHIHSTPRVEAGGRHPDYRFAQWPVRQRLGLALRNRGNQAIDREILLRVLTVNLMILLFPLPQACFLQGSR
jgi:hypothetical protein